MSDDLDESARQRVRWPMLAAVAGISTLLVVGWLVIDKDMNGMPLLSDGVGEQTAPPSAADIADICAEQPLLTVVPGNGGRTVVAGTASEGLTLDQAESALAGRGYDVTFLVAPPEPERTEPGDVISLSFGGDTVAVIVDGDLVLVEPGDNPITAEVACHPH